MRIVVAGATGAIGLPLVRSLVARAHVVYGIARSAESARILSDVGASPLMADSLDARAIEEVVVGARPDVVVEQLTSLPKNNSPEFRRASADLHNRVRLEGGANVQHAAIQAGARRYVAQSSAFWCEPGEGVASLTTPLATAVDAPAVAAGARTLFEVEQRVLGSDHIRGIVLRYGFFYGPRTWYAPDGSTADQVRARGVPVIGDGSGMWSFVHIDDAVAATVAAVERDAPAPARYNITGDHSVALRDWLPAYAAYLGAPPPPVLSESTARQTMGEDAVFYAMRLRGVSNETARHDLGFRPRGLEWMIAGHSGARRTPDDQPAPRLP